MLGSGNRFYHINQTRPTLERRKTLGHLRSINRNMIIHFANQSHPWEKHCHGELTVVTGPSPMITVQSRLREVTAQSRRGHNSITASSVWSRLGHSSITVQVTADCDHFGHREVTVSSRWAHCEQSRWPFFSPGQTCQLLKILKTNFFQTFHEKNLWKVVQSIPGLTDRENLYRLSRASYIYIYIYIYIHIYIYIYIYICRVLRITF